ncbi:MAG: L,D-transpeptidase [Gemmatimonadaceae bacterium]
MRSLNVNAIVRTAVAAAVLATPSFLHAQVAADTSDSDSDAQVAYSFKSKTDSLSWARHRELASKASGFRVVVSLQDHHLWAIVGEDTVLSAPAAVAKGTTLDFGKSSWTFETPRGVRTVLDKSADPIWQPPEWLYAETALEHDLKLGHLYPGKPIKLSDGRLLTIRDNVVGVIDDGEFGALPTNEHIVFDNTLYVPPLGTKNRKVEGELGKYRLNLGDGYLLHGTPYQDSIGMAATHGCVRLRDEDIQWLYDNVPVGTRVYIY